MSVALRLEAEANNLLVQHHPELVRNGVAAPIDQCRHVGRRGVSGVDDEVGVRRRHLRATDAGALEARTVDQRAGRTGHPFRQAVAQGIVINALAILSPEPMPWNPFHTHPPGGLAAYFREHVAGGPGSFVMVVEDFQSFAYALANKLIKEIAEAPPP